jgi:glycosyl transferase family 87
VHQERDPFAARVDVFLYGGSAVVTMSLLLFASVPLYGQWAGFAIGPYVVGAVAAAVLSGRSANLRARTVLAAVVFAGAALVPLAFELTARSNSAPGLHVQSEVLVTEEGAKALLDGRDPYDATYLHGSLSARPVGTKTHFPYAPGMLAFGLPRALDGHGPLSDGRVAFTVTTLVVAGLALRRPGPAGGKLRAAQALLILPTGSLLMATGGDDLPVLALLLLAFVLLNEDRPGAAGLAVGAASALKQTAWVVLPFMIVAAASRRGRRRFGAAGMAVVLPVILPFVLWHPAAFVEDVIRFPIGLGREPSAAGTPSVGSLLRHAIGGHPTVAVVVVLVMLAAAAAWLLRRPGSREIAGAARNAGILFVAALVLAPSVRAGYVVYPINLFAWGWTLLRPRTATVGSVTTDSSGDPR